MLEQNEQERARLMESFAIQDEEDQDEARDRSGHHTENASLHSIGMDWKSLPRVIAAHGLQLLSRAALRITQIPARVKELGYSETLRVVFDYPAPEMKLRDTAWLDGLRGIAAFQVFIFHYIDGWIDRTLAWGNGKYQRPEWYYAPLIRSIYGSGDAAVCIFFGISGYVLTHKMLSLMRQQRYDDLFTTVSSAVFRRGVRLYMPVFIETLLLMLACRVLGMPWPVLYEPQKTFFLEVDNWARSFGHLLMPLRYPDRWDAIINKYDGGISWTIPLEYYGSLYVYFSVVFLARVPSIFLRRCLIFIMVFHSFCKDDWIAAQFLMGMAFADYQIQRESNPPKPNARHPWLRPLTIWVILLFGFFFSGMPGARARNEYEGDYRIFSRPYYDIVMQPIAYLGLYVNRQMDRYMQCLAGMCILIGIGETPVLKRALEIRPIQYLGRISFGLYLCHIFVRAWMRPLFGAKVWIAVVGLDPNISYDRRPTSENFQLFIAYLLTMIPATIVNFVVGGLFRKYLDQPSVDAGKKFEHFCLSYRKHEGAKPILNGDRRGAGTPVQMQDMDVTNSSSNRAPPQLPN